MRTFFITLLLVIVSLSPVFSQPKYEIRATWITTLGGMDWPRNKAVNASGIRRQQKELCDILDRLKAANFNTVLLQTRLRGDMIYPSAIETFAESRLRPACLCRSRMPQTRHGTTCMDCYDSCRKHPSSTIART